MSTDRKHAEKSLKEEEKAVSEYKSRLKSTKDKKLRKFFKHAIPDEEDHADRLKKWRRSSEGKMRN